MTNRTFSGALNPSSTFSNPESVTPSLSRTSSLPAQLVRPFLADHSLAATLAFPLLMQSMSSNRITEFGGTSLIAVISVRSLKSLRLIA